jgi:hypothetical protein
MLILEMIAKIRRAFFVQGKPIKAICRELRIPPHPSRCRDALTRELLSEEIKDWSRRREIRRVGFGAHRLGLVWRAERKCNEA